MPRPAEPPEPELARRQAELVAALVRGGEPPAGFDADDLDAATGSIARKRRRAVARAWPTLDRGLEPGFEAAFGSYATQRPPPPGGGFADGLAFARQLRREGQLPPAALLELAAFETRWRLRGGRVVARRVPAVRIAAFRRPPRLVVLVSAPRLGGRAWEVRLPEALAG